MLKNVIIAGLIAGAAFFYFHQSHDTSLRPATADDANLAGNEEKAFQKQHRELMKSADALINRETPTDIGTHADTGLTVESAHASGDAEDAFHNHRSGVIITAEGVVDRVLQDDNDGSRHQRFILRLASGQTLLIAHNIDLSSRIPIDIRSYIKLHGEYEWNDKGGIVHWTHKDPQQKHEAGWIETAGRRYD